MRRLRDVGQLPVALTTGQLAELTGVGERVWWEVARGEVESSIDIQPIRVGRRGVLRWPTRPVLVALGLADDGPATTSPRDAARDSVSRENDGRPGGGPGVRIDIDHGNGVEDDGST